MNCLPRRFILCGTILALLLTACAPQAASPLLPKTIALPTVADPSSQNSLEWFAGGADGALYSTVQDLYLWDQALYTERLVPQAQLDQMFAAQSEPVLGPLAYGYGWFVGKYQGRLIAEHAGRDSGAGTVIARYPDDQIAIIVLSNQRSSDVRQIMLDLSNKIFGDQ